MKQDGPESRTPLAKGPANGLAAGDTPPVTPYAGVAVAVAAISSSAILVRLASSPAAVTATYRLLFTVALMAPFILLFHRRELRQVQARDWLFCFVSGLFLAFHFVSWFESLDLTTVASSTVLATLQPLFAFAGAFLVFGERLALRAIGGGLLAIAGSMVIGWGDLQISGDAFLGDALALLAALLAVGYFMFGQSVRQRLSLMVYTFIVYGMATAVLLIYDVANGYALTAYPTTDWFYFLLMAIGPTLLGHSMLNWSVKWLGVSVISMAVLLEPIGASVLAYIILDEAPHLTQYIGGAIILLGIFVFLYYGRPPGRPSETLGE
ncbi:DMT family transporter [Ferruginivarius sediminum]|uniref:DMT family transporter n=1 Tax=Ferruginivarius sediminum TaxID=2661937 RepID=A0A369TDF9_9PROT|nr:DMT family transporter [Ferruginivarius sediminum]RDD62872.1 DMT family transporter [Ferruginivarius sediminum]